MLHFPGRSAQELPGNKCWVCVDGQVVQVSDAEAKSKGLRCYTSQAEARRIARTPPRPVGSALTATSLSSRKPRPGREALMLRFPARGTAELPGEYRKTMLGLHQRQS